MSSAHEHPVRLARALRALDGLSIGDAFGQRFFTHPPTALAMIEARAVPRGPWPYTDDTEMALALYGVLDVHQRVDRDALALAFGARYAADPARGYGGTAHQILQDIAAGTRWAVAASSAFGGQGSLGNGAAMRVAPAAAYFADDLDAALAAAEDSAAPTHAHPEGVAGALAVAAACVWSWRADRDPAFRAEHPSLLRFAFAHTPAGATADGLARALHLPADASVSLAVSALGNGTLVTAPDTVPFSLWCAARHRPDFEESLWNTVEGLGDRDTTCAIVGGVVALADDRPLPAAWLAQREPLQFVVKTPEDPVVIER